MKQYVLILLLALVPRGASGNIFLERTDTLVFSHLDTSTTNALRLALDSLQPNMTAAMRAEAAALLLRTPEIEASWTVEGSLWVGFDGISKIDTTQLDLVVGNEKYYYNYYGSFNWGYGPRWGRMHRGWDLGLEVGDTVRANFNGVVRYAEYNDGGYGNCVIVSHPNGLETLYGHLEKILCQRGDLVFAGEVLGLGGSTGRSTGPHLHNEWRYRGHSFDPIIAVDTATQQLKGSELVLTSNLFAPPSSSELSKSAGSRRTYHTVRSGETLSSIARKYKTTVSKIIKLNNLKNPDRLSIGQKLRVK